MAFNYVDAFQSSSQLEYESKQHDAAVELQGRKCYIFMLDREKTEKSEIYNEAINGRIYLPHFEQRALYNTNEWTNNINLNNFVQTEDTMNFEFNFARMVCAIRDLKDKKAGTLIVKNTTEEILHLKTENNRFCLTSKNFVNLLDLDLTKYKSIAAFINDANKKSSVLELSYEGDIILTDKYKLYQVNNVYPTGLIMNDYISWTCKCNVMDNALANLPNDYRKIVARNQYALPKTKIS